MADWPEFPRMLRHGQQVAYACIGVLGGYSLGLYGWSGPAITPLLLSLIAALLSWVGPQIVHELAEINDQLAGRSPEFHMLLGRAQGPGSAEV
jgi:hypothetical protein